jgi:flagellar biosynthetic protein FlhB
MAEGQDDTEKTEDPTGKKLDDALKRGDVAKSQEVSTWFIIAGATLVLVSFSGPMGMSLKTTLTGLLANSYRLPADGGALLRLTSRIGLEVIAAIAIPLFLLMLAAIAGNMIQHRLVWSGESLKPKLDRVSPLAGLKRLFSKHALVNFVKGLLKLALIGSIMTVLLWPERDRLESFITLDVAALLPMVKGLTLKLLGAVVAVLAFIAAADFMFQYHTWYQRQKMSFQDLKEEYKQTEGDPHIKARIRRLREQRTRKRMMAAIPEASVVITNPTHYAVALKYERGQNAPVCVAKGLDLIALKIREVADKHGVPIVESPPLARALHATVDIDQEIPPEHYRAVAEIISYVMKLKQRLGR